VNLFAYVLRRLLFGFFVLLLVVTITFILTHNLGGNVIVAWLGKSASIYPKVAALYVAKYHLNAPIWVQYYYYIVGLVQGDFGFSPSRGFVPVLSVIGETLPYTIQLVIFGFIISMVLGVLLGMLSARYSSTPIDEGIRAFYLAGYASPTFFVALILLITFSLTFKIFPSGGAVDLGVQRPTWITGLPILDSLLEGNWAYFISGVQHTILPGAALALTTFGVVTRVLRSSLLGVMNMNYIRTARAKGCDESTVFYKHGLRNALIPVVTLSSLLLTWLITGTVFVENVFSYPGIGQYVVSALVSQDYPGLLGTTIVFALTIVIGNLIADLLYVVVDPQVRLG
jgi:peptide/nickel transport system permease protein